MAGELLFIFFFFVLDCFCFTTGIATFDLILLHSELPKLYGVLAVLSATGLILLPMESANPV